MGEPVKILDMARSLIKLSGLEPDKDIKIKFIGLRPGEKLYEELLTNEEGMRKTENDRIYIGKSGKVDQEKLYEDVEELWQLADKQEIDQILVKLKKLVPGFQPNCPVKPETSTSQDNLAVIRKQIPARNKPLPIDSGSDNV